MRPERQGLLSTAVGPARLVFCQVAAVMPVGLLPQRWLITTAVLHSFQALKAETVMRLVQEYASKTRRKDA